MAVTHVDNLTERSHYDVGGYHATRRYRVTFDAVAWNSADALIADDGSNAIPLYGATHDTKTTAYVYDKTAEQESDKDRLHYIVTVQYKEMAVAPHEDPTDEDPDISWEQETRTEVAVIDKDGNPILNSANDWFDPPLMKDFRTLRVVITRNESSFDPADADDYTDTVNVDTVTIAGLTVGPRKAKLVQYTGQKEETRGYKYYRVTYKVDFWRATWSRKVIDHGYRAFKTVGTGKARIREARDADGNVEYGFNKGWEEVTEPVPLDNAGHILNTSGTATPAQIAAKMLTFHICDEREFWRLGLPTSMD